VEYAQNPQIGIIRPANQRILAILVMQINHDICAIKGAEERHLQITLVSAINKIGLALGFFPLLFVCIVTAIDHPDATGRAGGYLSELIHLSILEYQTP
jgi:hypothetical protein